MAKSIMACIYLVLAHCASAQWSTSSLNIYYSGGSAGIGTNSPNDFLEVSGGNLRMSVSPNATNGIKLIASAPTGFNCLTLKSLCASCGVIALFGPTATATGNPYVLQGLTNDGGSAVLAGGRSSRQHVLASSNDQTNGSPWDLVLSSSANNTDWSASGYCALTVKAGAPSNSMYLSAAGYVGVGTASPLSKLHVAGSGAAALYSSAALSGASYPVAVSSDANGDAALFGDGSMSPSSMAAGALLVSVKTASSYASVSSLSSASSGAPMVLALNPSGGSVGIGTTAPGPYQLAVQGSIGARKVSVTQASPWADYVLGPSYRLKRLHDVEAFIKEHDYLEGAPTAKEVREDGLDLGSGEAVLLKKIEELTLYVIAMHKRSQEKGLRIRRLQERLDRLAEQRTAIKNSSRHRCQIAKKIR